MNVEYTTYGRDINIVIGDPLAGYSGGHLLVDTNTKVVISQCHGNTTNGRGKIVWIVRFTEINWEVVLCDQDAIKGIKEQSKEKWAILAKDLIFSALYKSDKIAEIIMLTAQHMYDTGYQTGQEDKLADIRTILGIS